ncbi:peroxisomal membrane 22 kDa (Mpv17/PMP22) family protein [Carex rostrata]
MGVLRLWGLWWNLPPNGGRGNKKKRSKRSNSSSPSSDSVYVSKERFQFPYKQAATAASLTLTGDTIAQFRDKFDRWRKNSGDAEDEGKELASILLSDHDWLRALRMTSYGLFLYGPGSYAWYQILDRCMPQPSFVNISVKVILNQIVLGPCVIAIIFAWNNLWLGKLSDLPSKYQKDALPTLLYGFRFWIPVSVLNFGVVPLSTRVAFMSSCSIFWNFYLSSTMSK